MWGALLTRNQKLLEQKLKQQLEQDLNQAKVERDNKILKVQNKAIRKIQKLNIEYKYSTATKSMIHDWEKSQAWSMLAALRYIWVLS